jgi:hypothetical protein
MRRPPASLTAAAALVAVGCGAADRETLPVACLDGDGAVVRALRAAPGPVTLDDGTRLSACVSGAQADSELQSVGLILSTAAERMAAGGDAVGLGYLIGASRRGAEQSAGIALELVRRLESAARQVDDAAGLREGLHAGEATG